MNENDSLSEDREVLAAELALGLLDDDARREALSLRDTDLAFAANVRKWQRIVDSWNDTLAAEPVDQDLLTRIEQAIDTVPSVIPFAQARPMASGPGRPWRTWAITAMAASVVLAVALGMVLVRQPAPQAQLPLLSANVAQIDSAAGKPLMSALYQPRSGSLSLRVAPMEDQGRLPELWVIPEGGMPTSLGLLQSDKLTISLSPELRAMLVEGATLAITLEPREGAPHDAPSGDVLGAATLQSIEGGPVS
ncbi:MAG: anti-sigma factor [Croceibacterium sp.]